MIDFPKSTVVRRRLPKEAFYQHLSLTATLKARFVSDVEQIQVENSLTQRNLNLENKSDIKEILLLSLHLKKQDFDGKIVEAIARQNPHKLIFLLMYGECCQLAVYHRKLYRTAWMKENDLSLVLQGNTLEEIWDNLVRQIAISSEEVLQRQELPIDEQLKRQDEINRLKKLIQKTEAAAWKEQQPKKGLNDIPGCKTIKNNWRKSLMEKLEMHTADLAKENYEKLAALFPNAVTETVDEEGHVVRAIDKDVLMQEINTQVVDDGQERYQFTWPDKRKTIMLANQPIAKTLILDRKKSFSRDGTQGGGL